MRWTSSNTAVFNLGYHIIWCPKYRRKVLVEPIDARLKEGLNDTANEHGWRIEKMEVLPDHVHIFIKINPTDNIAYVVNRLKGVSRQRGY